MILIRKDFDLTKAQTKALRDMWSEAEKKNTTGGACVLAQIMIKAGPMWHQPAKMQVVIGDRETYETLISAYQPKA